MGKERRVSREGVPVGWVRVGGGVCEMVFVGEADGAKVVDVAEDEEEVGGVRVSGWLRLRKAICWGILLKECKPQSFEDYRMTREQRYHNNITVW